MTPDDLPALPYVFRPVRSRRVIWAVAVVLLVTMVALGFAVPRGRGTATVVDQLSLLVFWLVAVAVLVALARPRVVVEDSGLLVVNLVRRRPLDWAQVVGVRFGSGDPWVVLDLSDGTTLAVMGIQRSDGPGAERAARQLAALIRAHQPTD